PPIHTARLTPPFIATANRNSACVATAKRLTLPPCAGAAARMRAHRRPPPSFRSSNSRQELARQSCVLAVLQGTVDVLQLKRRRPRTYSDSDTGAVRDGVAITACASSILVQQPTGKVATSMTPTVRGAAMANLDKLLFQPTFEKPKAGEPRGPRARDDSAAIVTYRYLRFGMVVIAFALVVSILYQWRTAGCWQGSISAYYYTPARPIFVSGMIAIAISLMVIKGSTPVEDLLLNTAGMLAPVVAFVPTTFEPPCVRGQALVKVNQKLPNDIIRHVENNIFASLVAGFLALAIAILVLVIEQYRNDKVATRYVRSRIALVALTGLFLIVGVWLLANDKILELHGQAAFWMFVALGLASIVSGIWVFIVNRGDGPKTTRHWTKLGVSYIVVGVVMGVAGAIITFWPDPWDHRTLVLEMTEIGLFVAMWIVQSFERWGKILQAEP
ncbi:MAG: hypothetical protein LC808_26095, partial [Actinobacteria bacterium]|nr:hypothetical protein [Actinomycetota bacterium]